MFYSFGFLLDKINLVLDVPFQLLKWMKKPQRQWELILRIIKFYPLHKELFLLDLPARLFAHVMAYISPADFSYHRAVDILIYAIFGGSEVIWGAVFGATFMTVLPEALTISSVNIAI